MGDENLVERISDNLKSMGGLSISEIESCVSNYTGVVSITISYKRGLKKNFPFFGRETNIKKIEEKLFQTLKSPTLRHEGTFGYGGMLRYDLPDSIVYIKESGGEKPIRAMSLHT